MLRNIFFILMISLVASACSKPPKKGVEIAPGMESFGAKISPDGAMAYDALLEQLKTKPEMTAKVRGKIEAVCQTKGCWMNIVSETPGKKEMFVKFKDYGFFMPLDATGKEVIIEGRAFTEETSVDELRHYAEDEGKSAEEIAKITEPVNELKFMADGVILLTGKK